MFSLFGTLLNMVWFHIHCSIILVEFPGKLFLLFLVIYCYPHRRTQKLTTIVRSSLFYQSAKSITTETNERIAQSSRSIHTILCAFNTPHVIQVLRSGKSYTSVHKYPNTMAVFRAFFLPSHWLCGNAISFVMCNIFDTTHINCDCFSFRRNFSLSRSLFLSKFKCEPNWNIEWIPDYWQNLYTMKYVDENHQQHAFHNIFLMIFRSDEPNSSQCYVILYDARHIFPCGKKNLLKKERFHPIELGKKAKNWFKNHYQSLSKRFSKRYIFTRVFVCLIQRQSTR